MSQKIMMQDIMGHMCGGCKKSMESVLEMRVIENLLCHNNITLAC